MEAQEEVIGGSNDRARQILKRKRTKRQRSSSLVGVTAVTSSSSSGGGGGCAVVEDYGSITSPTTSSDVYESREGEEEDMANCLIMLARGDFHPRQDDQTRKEKFRAQKFAEEKNKVTGLCVYECKTCGRTFSSFQALGGHRASHKKPRPMVIEEKKESSLMTLPAYQEIEVEEEEESWQFNKINPTGVSFRTPNKGKTHECSICGLEFTSGQALGGHMRRHRVNSGNNNQAVDLIVEKSNSTNGDPADVRAPARNILSLDLNLPAPEDDHHHGVNTAIESKFQFASSTHQPLVFSAPALVDCHY